MFPFGLKHKGYNNQITGRDHQYGYGFNGEKEEQNELGLNWIDYGARNYDASLGRWFAVDNMAEKFYDWTPYKYGMDNPILYTDPDGNCETCWSFLKSVYNYAKDLQTKGSALTTRTSKATDEFFKPTRELSNRASAVVTLVSVTSADVRSSAINDHVEKSKALYEIQAMMGGQGVGMTSGLRFTTSKAGKVVLEKGAKFANAGEEKIANLLASEGKMVEVLAESTEKGVKTADFMIDGIKTELKTISNLTGKDLSNSLKKRILSGVGQSGNLIIDLTGQKGGTKELALKALNRAFGASKDLKSVRIIGEGFDITRKAQ